MAAETEQNAGTRVGAVSVVIPTRNRPELVRRAVANALAQTLAPAEVVVVIDGPDEATQRGLMSIEDPRLRVLPLPEPCGAAGARNAGVRTATGSWVAFLDDDDEWLPAKLHRQMAAAQHSGSRLPILSCRLTARTARGPFIWPRRLPDPGESVGDYLFLRRSFEEGDSLLQTSTLLAPRDLLLAVPWRSCAHDEWDWLLRAAAVDGVGLQVVPEALAIWNADVARDRLSLKGSWRATAEWLRSVAQLLEPRTHASFLLSSVSQWARLEGDWRAFPGLLREAFRHGRPSAVDTAVHIARWMLPSPLRHFLRRITAHTVRFA